MKSPFKNSATQYFLNQKFPYGFEKNKYLPMKNIKISVLFLLMGTFSLNAQSLKSPDGKFEMNFQLKAGVPYYDLKYQGKTVVEDSK